MRCVLAKVHTYINDLIDEPAFKVVHFFYAAVLGVCCLERRDWM